MTHINSKICIALATALSLSIAMANESRADNCGPYCASCIFDGYCGTCIDGYANDNGSCKACASNEELVSGKCAKICASDEERYYAYPNYICLKKCADDEFRENKTCKKIPTCEGGNTCKTSNGNFVSNCCYKTEGDTTTVYPDDKSQGYNAKDAVFPDNKNMVISSGATDFNCPQEETAYENVYISEGVGMQSGNCHCCFGIRDDLKFVIPDSGITGLNFQNNSVKFACLGDIDACKQNVGSSLANNVVAATESQCNGSGSYYFTGSSCEHRPTDGTGITCEHEISGYVKVGNYCVSPENSYAKKHYTPAEAAQWLNDGNDNFVILTFKK